MSTTSSDTPTGSTTPSASLRRYVAAWVLGGAALAVGVVVYDGVIAIDVPTILPLLVLTAVAETVSVNLHRDQSGVALSLLETAVVIDLLLLGTDGAVIAVVGGVTLQHLLRRLPPIKLLFNMGEHAVGVSVAAILMMLAPEGPVLAGPRVLVVGVAVFAYRVINNVALAGVFTRLQAPELRDHIAHRPLALVASILGSASLGVIALNVWITNRPLVWIVAAPAVALYLAYVASYRIEGLLADVRIERDRLGRVVGGVGEGIVLVDAAGTVQVWNRAMGAILGGDEAATVGRRADELLAGVDEHGVPLEPVATMADRDGDQAELVMHVCAADGERRPLRLTWNALREDGRASGGVLVVQDLTREREANALKEDFVAQVSHELRTPLSPLRGYAQALRQAGDRIPAAKRAEIHGLMVERVDHLEQLVDDLLLVSAIGAGRPEPTRNIRRAPVDLGPLLPRLVSWLSAEQTAGRRIEVVGHERANRVLGDGTRVAQIVTNLLTNACKYSAPDTDVVVEVSENGGQVHVAVRDRGPGIPEDKLEAVFERFERLDDPQRMRAGGIGLGLYISRYLAEAMDGRLTASSALGVGSTFVLSLPAVPDEAATGTDAAQAPSVGARV